jgi:glucose/arabinose dehydrogenase
MMAALGAGSLPAAAAPGNFFTVLLRGTGLSEPIGVTGAGDGSNRLFILERDGRIRVWANGQVLATPFLDLTTEVLGGGEQGLLGLAFHPDYENNGFFYVKYTCDGGTADCPQDGDLILARYQVSAGNPNVANPASRAFMLWMDQPFSNHNGGHLAFGPDNLLYIACGDGGAGGDTLEVAQDLSRRAGNRGMLGKMLRLDVDQNVNQAPFYGIPAGNPWGAAGDPGDAINDEVWAFGLRNPWRYSFDRLTGDLYIGDVGQGTREEVSLLTAPLAPAQNLGWDVLEGTFCHEDVPAGSCTALLNGGSLLPILEYGRNEGSTIIGGHVYRGRPASQLLTGTYVFADLGSSRVWRGIRPAGSGPWTKQLLFNTNAGLSSFGEGDQGNLYFVGLFDGGLYQIAPYTFADTPPQSFGWSFVESIFEAGISGGCGGDNFCPAAPNTRGEMAVFLLRASQGSSYTPPPCSNATFADVPCTHPFADWIYDLVSRGITAGCGGGNYCPSLAVTRQEMAVFLLLSSQPPGYTPPPCTTPTFNDVPCSNVFAAWIEDLVSRGITGGCGGGNYCPGTSVSRAQMAVFLVATFGLIPV